MLSMNARGQMDAGGKNFLVDMFSLRDKSKVNIFETSRLIPEIMEKFETCKRMDIRASEDDVRRYVRGQLERGTMEHLPSLIKRKPELKDEIIKGISDAVDGMFLLAKIYLDTLVDKVTVTDVREAVKQLPKQISGSGEDKILEILNQAYESAWERINGQKEGFRNIATRVLAWISSAKRPLSTKELQHALAVKIGMDELDEDAIPQVQDMVSFCAGLVTVDEESDVIRLVHYTTQEFFEKKKTDWFCNVEAMIAETCISYLSFTAFGERCLDWSGVFHLSRRHFYRYASYYWGDHARTAGRKLDGIVLEFLMNEANASNAFYVMLERFRTSPGCIYLNPSLIVSVRSKRSSISRKPFPPVSGLHIAVCFMLDEVINLLLKSGCDVNVREGVEVTPLLMAIDIGHIGIVEMLLDNGAHTNSVAGDSIMYLNAAMQPRNNNEGLVQRLITKGIHDGEDLSTYLEPAARFGHEAIVKLLLDKGADINATDKHLNTPLHEAIIRRQEAMVALLLNKGANINAVNHHHRTPLHIAARGEEVIVKLLLDKSADFEAADYDGKTPLHYAAAKDKGIVELLLNKGANIEAADHHGQRPLHNAVRKDKAIVELLLDKGADINAVDEDNATPLRIAARCNAIEIGKFLIDKGANFETADLFFNKKLRRYAARYRYYIVNF
ncbi:hypothetical protein N5P37_010024 [Trichoderma harzianum]|nr:hypothetical protein N5P37_010024 [Trichoderma harzianum]